MPSDLEERIRDVEAEMWGIRGGGGLVRAVERLQEDFAARWAKEDKRRETEREESEAKRLSEKRWKVGIVLSVLGLIISVIAAAQMIASSAS